MMRLAHISHRTGAALTFVSPLLFFKYQHQVKLVRRDLIQPDPNAHPKSILKMHRTPQQHSSLG